MWRKNLNIDVNLENNEWKVYLNKIREGDYQIGRMGGVAEFKDPVYFFEIWKENGGNNFTNWHSDEYTKLLEKS
jgi:oligopeptide transport system substrate-binding protein